MENDEIIELVNANTALIAALKNFANLDTSVNSDLWSIRPDFCEQARKALKMAGAE